MVPKKLTYLSIIIAVICSLPLVAQEKVNANQDAVETKMDKQLKLNRQALLSGSLDAAVLILEDPDPVARKIILDILNAKTNIPACRAISKALIQSRIEQKPVISKDDFIKPLLDLLAASDADNVNLVADACLIFTYDHVSDYIEIIASDPKSPPTAKINIITALKRRPDKKAILKLMQLLEDKDAKVASAAESALKSIGIPVGKDEKTRQQNMKDLSRKGKDEFLSDWLTRQQETMQKLAKENMFWKKQTLDALDKVYDSITDDAERGAYLVSNLKSTKVELRLWALEKAAQWRKGTNPKKIPAELGQMLISLVSDPDSTVRLKTANLLAIMNELNSAQKLLTQVKVEQDQNVKMELFIALGGACYYAFLPNSPTKISPEIKIQTLDLAAEYLKNPDSDKAQRGSEVIKKLLEQDGLPKEKVTAYLNMLKERFNLAENDQLRSELLSAMGAICAQSIYKKQAITLYKPLFEQSLHSETDVVRETAVDGLIYIDRAEALKILRNDYINDSCPRVVQSIIKLANDVGSVDDLDWLAEKIASKEHSDIAWLAMLKIFKSSPVDLLEKWVDKICLKKDLTNEQKLSFLDIVEAKAVTEKKSALLAKVRPLLADIYEKSGNFTQAANYIKLMLQNTTEQQKQALSTKMLILSLKTNNLNDFSEVLTSLLAKQDLTAQDPIILAIDQRLKDQSYIDANKKLIENIKKIKLPQNAQRPLWNQQVEKWTAAPQPAKTPEK